MIYEFDNRYQIRPSGNALCWEIFELRTFERRAKNDAGKLEGTGETAVEWTSMGRYPSTLKAATRDVFEFMLRDDAGVVQGVKGLKAHIEEVEARIIAGLAAGK